MRRPARPSRPPLALRATLLALALAALPAGAAGQEAQVPLDRDGRLMEIDRPLAQRMGLFLDDYPDLQVVRLYQLADGSYVLEVTLRRDGRVFRERVPMTADEADALRARAPEAILAEMDVLTSRFDQLDREIRSTQIQLDRSECYETWLFSRTLRRSRTCVGLAQKSEDMRRRQSELDIQRQQIMGESTRS